jgi:SAM-dependent methyltransferase
MCFCRFPKFPSWVAASRRLMKGFFMSNFSKYVASDGLHIDLGCGANPRNPYNLPELVGVDIRGNINSDGVKTVACDLFIERLPFKDNSADAISAFDFLEHIPRVLHTNGETIFPFVRIMSEVFRVLKPNGVFHAVTPVFPKESSVVDPTHVNLISKNTHKYFTHPHCWAQMYGFEGQFKLHKAKIINFHQFVNSHTAINNMILLALGSVYPKSKQHIFWKMTAIK